MDVPMLGAKPWEAGQLALGISGREKLEFSP